MRNAVIAERHRLVYVATVYRAFHTIEGFVAVQNFVNNVFYPVYAAGIRGINLVAVGIEIVAVARHADLLLNADRVEKRGDKHFDADDSRKQKRRVFRLLSVLHHSQNSRIYDYDNEREHYASH